MPGKPVQILKSVGTSNPVILIDEIGTRPGQARGRGRTVGVGLLIVLLLPLIY